MSQLYQVRSRKAVHFNDPLHWSNFFPDKQRFHHNVMNKRQDLILYLANLHSTACRSGMPLGMIHIPMRLMSLRDWCQDYRIVLDHFFEVQQLGFNLGEGNCEISTLVPRNLTLNTALAASTAAASLEFDPGPIPDYETSISKVYVQLDRAEFIFKRLKETARLDLVAPVEWLFKTAEVNFHFVRSGKLKLRDTSVWPIASIETWPSWLREELFGPGIDVDSAYTQFLVSVLKKEYAGRESLMKTLYPDLLKSITEKTAWRTDICKNVLGLEPTEENIGTVKRLCMSLANGSRISPAILTGSRSFSITADLIIERCEDVSPSNLLKIGQRLQSISKQYKNARKIVCSSHLHLNPTRTNQKTVFSSYFEWERNARYAIWEKCDRHGIMVHDGIDGIPQKYIDRLPQIMNEIGIKITA